MMEQPIEQRGDGGDVAQQVARVLDGVVRGDQLLVIDQRIHDRLTFAQHRDGSGARVAVRRRTESESTVPVRCVRTAGPVRGGRVATTEVFG
jgi:hypothetical protein